MNKSMKLQMFYHKLWALSLLPEDCIEDAFIFLKSPDELPIEDTMDKTEEELTEVQDFNRRLLNFIRYFERTWLGEKLPSGGRKRPLFDHHLWNKNEAILEEEDLTTNGSEAINLQISASLETKKKKNLFNVFLKLKQEETKSISNLFAAAAGDREGSHNPGRLKEIQLAKQKRKKLVESFDREDIPTFLKVAASYYDYSKL
mgnify:CR=1 FL=1